MKNHQNLEDLEIAKAVILQEIEGMHGLLNSIDLYLIPIINELKNISGKIVISGIGKSGHIGRKIASTFSSIGFPAIFLHPSEAGHGDLGTIAKGDIVFLISNSGESADLGIIIHYCKKIGVKIIGITRQANSTLDRVANISVVLPNIPEANTLNIPTTSSIMTLAFGDALAMVLKKHMNFSSDDYRLYHPSGFIGAQLLKVDHIMHTDSDMPIILDDKMAIDAIDIMTEKRLGCVGVINRQNELIGMITDGDLRRKVNTKFDVTQVSDIMTMNPITIHFGTLAVEAMVLMEHKRINQIFIVNDQNKPIGVIHLHDLIRAGI